MLGSAMSSFHIRPRFRQVVEMDPDAVREKIITQLSEKEDQFEVKNFTDFVCLRIHQKDRHFWSPRLNLSLESADEPGKTIIHGIYGPNANVWSLMLFSYLIVGFLGFIAGVIGVSQWVIGTSTWGFWLLGIAAVLLIALYVVAQTGQKLGAQQTFFIHQAYESAVGTPVEVH